MRCAGEGAVDAVAPSMREIPREKKEVAEVTRRKDDGSAARVRRSAGDVVDHGRGQERERSPVVATRNLHVTHEARSRHVQLDAVADAPHGTEVEQRDRPRAPATGVEHTRGHRPGPRLDRQHPPRHLSPGRVDDPQVGESFTAVAVQRAVGLEADGLRACGAQ